MTEPALWMVGGLVLAGLEMLAPGVFLLWIGLAALGTGAATVLLGLGWHGQVGWFVVLTIGLVGLIGLRLRGRKPGVGSDVNAPGAGLVGRTCRVLEFQGLDGRVSLGDGTWYARLAPADQVVPVPGQALRVVGLDGTTLLVAATSSGDTQ